MPVRKPSRKVPHELNWLLKQPLRHRHSFWPLQSKTAIMKLRHFFQLVVLLGLTASCDNDSEIKATIVGKWQGDKANLNVKPDGFPFGVPYNVDNFDALLDFRSDGTLSVTDDNQTSVGTYEMEGDKLTITSDLMIEDINMSGTYHVRKLNLTSLEIQIEKDATVKNPNDGSDVSGTVKATLFFNKQ